MIFLIFLAFSIYSIYQFIKLSKLLNQDVWFVIMLISSFFTLMSGVLGSEITRFNNYGEISHSISSEGINKVVIKDGVRYYVDTRHTIKTIDCPVLNQNNKLPALVTVDQKQFNWLFIPWPTSHTKYVLHGNFQIKEVTQ